MYKLEEKKIIFDSDELFPHLPSLGYGSQGDVYKFRIGNETFALKVFYNFELPILSDYQKQLDIDIDSYISPKRLMYVNDEFKGYIMRLCKGKDLEKRRLNISVDEFAESTVKLMEDTEKLSKINYSIFDTYISNVMYDDGFKMIDMDNYRYEENKTYDEIIRINNRRLNQMLSEIFIKNANLSTFYFSNVEFRKLMKKCEDGDILFEELFNDLCTKAYNIADTELQNIGEVGKVLIKTKKI